MIILKKGREKPVQNRHPWIFSGAIDFDRSKLDNVQPGDVVEVRDAGGGFLAKGYYNPESQIRVRLQTWDQNDAVGPAWWRIQMARAIQARSILTEREDTNSYRLVYAESDGLPGLIVDRYGDYLVLQALTLGVEVMKESIVSALVSLIKPKGILERSDVDARQKEGLDSSIGLLWGEEPPTPLVIRENGITFLVDLHTGHKTGFYLDQRDSRYWALTRPEIQGKRVLNCFSYTGGFSVATALNGASGVISVDTSQPALDMAQETMSANGVSTPAEYIPADVFQYLRDCREAEETFDVIILDPPKFAHNRKQVERATRGYKDINMLALELLEPGGLLLTYSCSGQINDDLFQKVVFGASADAGVQAQIIHWFAQPLDHPVQLSFPEGRYLKGLACRVMNY